MDYQAILNKLPSFEPLPWREVEEILREMVEKLLELEERVKNLEK